MAITAGHQMFEPGHVEDFDVAPAHVHQALVAQVGEPFQLGEVDGTHLAVLQGEGAAGVPRRARAMDPRYSASPFFTFTRWVMMVSSRPERGANSAGYMSRVNKSRVMWVEGRFIKRARVPSRVIMPLHLLMHLSIKEPSVAMFEIKPLNPETYRRQTRRSTLIIALIFVSLAMVLSSAGVMLFGQPGGDNFYLNVAGVIAGLVVSVVLVRVRFWSQPWMASAVYGWQLKRSLMRITNVMHHVTAGVQARDPVAMKLLRFYHLGITQMHQLDANSSALSQMTGEIDRHRESMEALAIDTDQPRLNPDWLEAVKKNAAAS